MAVKIESAFSVSKVAKIVSLAMSAMVLLFACFSKGVMIMAPLYGWSFWNMLEMGFTADMVAFMLCSVVLTVTISVLIFSESYMEMYNNKKFLVITVSFLMSMLLLCNSSSWMIMVVGWEGLGITSVFLVMFYPNKTSMFNSILTMNYNRAGDAILMVLVCLCMSCYYNCWFMPNSECTNLAILGLMLCSMTKSAQYPLSSWLPAAMSAPTPISAMVHSSTLVAAGILVMSKMFYPMLESKMLSLFALVNIVTFVVGGFLSIYEADLKKTVAFSTMSQISMILLILSLGKFEQSLLHMANHAFFKSLLFVYLGVFFALMMGTQSPKMIKVLSKDYVYAFGLWLSLYSMMGMLFSSSFYSKDVTLEDLLSKSNPELLLMLILGSILTMVYSLKLMNHMTTNLNKTKISLLKKSSYTYLTLVNVALMLVTPKICFLFLSNQWMFMNEVCYMITILILTLPMAMKMAQMKPLMLNISVSLGQMKFALYTLMGLAHSKKFISTLSFSDMMFFKSLYLYNNEVFKTNNRAVKYYTMALAISYVFMLLMYSISSSNVALKMLSNKE